MIHSRFWNFYKACGKTFGLACLITCQLVRLASSQSLVHRFDLGDGVPEPGFTRVTSTVVYQEEVGYGFEPGAKLEAFDRSSGSALLSDGVTSQTPFYFSVKLPEGNYEITVSLGDAAVDTTTTVKAELRRLVLENVRTKSGEFSRRRFLVNVRRPELSDGSKVQLKDREKESEWWAWDDKLTLEFSGKRPGVCAIEIKPAQEVTTVFLLGDSTVCDQPREPFASWGQMLPRFFGPKAVVANHAQSGESLRSSRGAKRLAKVLDSMKFGDWVLIQFGHNDMKAVDEASYATELKAYTKQISEKGGKPIIITPMHRRTFEGNAVKNSHRNFPQAARDVAKEIQIPLIDLHSMSQTLYEAWGPQDSILAFSTPKDGTHHNNYGAYELAKCIVESIRQQRLDLASLLIEDLKAFDPAKPDPLAEFAVPASPIRTAQKPDGN